MIANHNLKPVKINIMKRFLPLIFATALPLSAFDVPRNFFTIDKLDEAQAEAAEKPKMVGFLITDPKMEPS